MNESDKNSNGLSKDALNALAEAAKRKAMESHAPMPVEINGREGPEPVRFGDWENKGRLSDF